MTRPIMAVFSVIAGALAALPAFAQEMPTPSFPERLQMHLQTPVTPVAEMIYHFHNFLLVIITLITLFVLALLIVCIVRYNEKANPVPAKWTHNTMLEVLWTGIPVLILIAIAVPSYRLLFFMDRAENAEMTLKVTGNQWFWSYEYVDQDVFFDSLPLAADQIDTAKGQHRLLEVDNHVVIPVDTTIRVLFTASDVIHAWTIPAFGVKLDNVPGRTNETWMQVTQLGRYYGQCSELCGVDHSFMPIVVDVVSKEDFDQWVASKKSAAAPATTQLAAVQN